MNLKTDCYQLLNNFYNREPLFQINIFLLKSWMKNSRSLIFINFETHLFFSKCISDYFVIRYLKIKTEKVTEVHLSFRSRFEFGKFQLLAMWIKYWFAINLFLRVYNILHSTLTNLFKVAYSYFKVICLSAVSEYSWTPTYSSRCSKNIAKLSLIHLTP